VNESLNDIDHSPCKSNERT